MNYILDDLINNNVNRKIDDLNLDEIPIYQIIYF